MKHHIAFGAVLSKLMAKHLVASLCSCHLRGRVRNAQFPWSLAVHDCVYWVLPMGRGVFPEMRFLGSWILSWTSVSLGLMWNEQKLHAKSQSSAVITIAALENVIYGGRKRYSCAIQHRKAQILQNVIFQLRSKRGKLQNTLGGMNVGPHSPQVQSIWGQSLVFLTHKLCFSYACNTFWLSRIILTQLVSL